MSQRTMLQLLCWFNCFMGGVNVGSFIASAVGTDRTEWWSLVIGLAAWWAAFYLDVWIKKIDAGKETP